MLDHTSLVSGASAISSRFVDIWVGESSKQSSVRRVIGSVCRQSRCIYKLDPCILSLYRVLDWM